MSVDTKQWLAQIGNFNRCLHYAVLRLKINLFHIRKNISQVLVFTCNTTSMHFKRQCCLLLLKLSIVFIMSPVVSELTLHAVCLRFKFRYFTKQIPTLHNIINLINVLSIGYFIHLPLILLQHVDIESNHGPKKKQVNSLSCCHWNVNGLLAQNLSKISQIEAYNSL